ncbi:uncharacterized protein LOC132173561 [Corylus avellana]|uniref:uncharacterized protein LOC132173561 n=1 Tax=Corylus avellana TaxID=13451 RepID=UPI00286A556D|nr:uncharacterized protein LOC132173561 [Corylus avellana]
MESNRTLQKFPSFEDDFASIFEVLLGKLEEEELQLCAVVARQIWLRRNVVVHGGEFIPPKMVIQQAKEQINSYELAMAVRQQPRGSIEVAESRWRRPPAGFVKLNWDASLDVSMAKMGFGVVARDHMGKVVAALCDSRPYCSEPEGAETLAAWTAAEFCLQLGLEKVCLEGDARVVVQAIQYEANRGGKYGHVSHDIAEMLGGLQEWRVQHVPREGNGAAHCLAKYALSCMERCIWLDDFPHCIKEAILADQAIYG